MNLSPSYLRDHVLQATRHLTKGVPNVPVRASAVVAYVLRELGVDPDSDLGKKAATNASWVGTQTLRKEGLLGPADRRGWWILTEGSGPVIDGHGSMEAPQVVEEVPRGPRGTQAPFTAPLQDPYSTDRYILSLAVAQTPCFGDYAEHDDTCKTCPISRMCRSTLFARLQEISDLLSQESQQSVPTRESIRDISLEEILKELSSVSSTTGLASDSSPTNHLPSTEHPRLAGVAMEVLVESLCCRCRQILPEKSIAMYASGVGYWHEHCP